jgi:polycystin 1L2
LENSFVKNIRAQKWYNGDEPRNLSGFINDTANRFIGWPTMRQLRVKPSSCSVQMIRSKCLHDYNLLNEEKDSYAPGWINKTTQLNNSSISRAFEYRTSDELDTYVYVGDHGSYNGDGYVYEFRGRLNDIRTNLSQLHQFEWIDRRTRAVIIQLSLYNPNVELFTSVNFLMEFLSTGGLIPQYSFEPIYFQGSIVLLFLVMHCFLFSYYISFSINLYDPLYGIYYLLYDCGN